MTVAEAAEETESFERIREKKDDYVLYRRSDQTIADDDDNVSLVPPDSRTGLVGTVTNMLGSAVRHIAGDELTNELFSPISSLQTDAIFEDDFSHHFT